MKTAIECDTFPDHGPYCFCCFLFNLNADECVKPDDKCIFPQRPWRYDEHKFNGNPVYTEPDEGGPLGD